MSAEDIACGPEYPITTAVTIACTAVLSVFLSAISAITWIRLWRCDGISSEDNHGTDQRQFRTLYYVQLAYLSCCAFIGILHPVVTSVLCYPVFHDSLSSWTMDFIGWCSATLYYYHWDGFIAILFLRLQAVFNRPNIASLQQYRGFNRISIFVLCTITIGYSIYVIMYLTAKWSLSNITFMASSLLFVLLMYSQALAFVFVRRLYRLNALAQRDDALIAAMTKMSLIALTSIFGSLLLITGLVICGLSGEQTQLNFVFVTVGSVCDVLLDTLFVSLSLNAHERYYERLCGRCDSRVKTCCVKLTDKTTRKKEMELAVATAAAQHGDQETVHSNTGSQT